MKRTRFSSLLLGLIVAATPVRGNVEVSNPNSPPLENIIFQQVPSGEFDFDYSWNNDYEIGQSFQALEDMTVTDITVSIGKLQPGAAFKAFTLNIYEIEGPAELPSEENLKSSQAGHLPPSLAPNTFLTFTLGNPIALKKGKWYTIMLVSKGEESGVGFPLLATDAVKDDTFTWYKDTETTLQRYTNRSLTFYVQGKKARE